MANAGDNSLTEASPCVTNSTLGMDGNFVHDKGAAAEFKGRILHLFSGPRGRHGGFAAYLQKQGWTVDEFDVINGQHKDLASDHVWHAVVSRTRNNFYEPLLAGPPCNIHQRQEGW